MSILFNDKLLLWGLGVIQPASPMEIINFLKIVYPKIDQWPDSQSLEGIFKTWLNEKLVLQTNKKYQLYSLTILGNSRLSAKLRVHRDKARVTLLRAVYDDNLSKSGAVVQDLDGVSPSLEARSSTQEGTRPVNLAGEPSRTESTRLTGKLYWPRVSEQLNFKVGLKSHTPDTPSLRYRYCSFPNLKSVKEASFDNSATLDLSISQLGLCIGLSPRLLTSFIHKPENHYRTFKIKKKSGGEREISSPRFFLKSVQYWIKSYLFCQLQIHHSCHAFLPKKSIITNAKKHLNKAFVANIDLENFFGSITEEMVIPLLKSSGYGPVLSKSVARLVTFKGVVPQGAPTSPDISNSILFDFDETIFQACQALGLDYTRYADDISISGSSKTNILKIIDLCRRELAKHNINLNEKKTRIASQNASQRVTGIMVNEKIQPPRDFQRKIRAKFHHANSIPEQYIGHIDNLRGYISYLNSFENLKGSKKVEAYNQILNKLISLKNSRTRSE